MTFGKHVLLNIYIFIIYVTQSVLRLHINDDKIYYPNGTEIRFQGFNMLWDQSIPITVNDPKVAKDYLPGINVARLVMVHWDDGKRNNPVTGQPYIDCMSNNQSNGYLKQECLDAFDERISWMQESNIWSIITLRGQYAAGGDYPTHSDIFHNITMYNQFKYMWGYLANRYKNTDYIAGMEIMSEPRTDVELSQVTSMYDDVCSHILSFDPNMICIIGAAKYYNLCNLNETMLLNNIPNNVIYAFNFFIPQKYDTNATDYPVSYPGQMKCCDFEKKCLPGHCQQNKCTYNVTINKQWLSDSMDIVINNFRNKYNKPIYIDQWGIWYNQTDYLTYVNDLLSLMADKNVGSTNWQWRTWKLYNYGIFHNESDGQSFFDENEIKVFQKYFT